MHTGYTSRKIKALRERGRQSATLLAVTYCPRLPLAEGVAAVLGRIDVFTEAARTALAEITGTPTDDL